MSQGFTTEPINIFFTTASSAISASYALSSSYAITASYALTSSWAHNSITSSYSLIVLSASYATLATSVTNPNPGIGTNNYLPKWSGSNQLTSTSNVYDTGTNVGIGTNTPQKKLHITESFQTDLLTIDSALSGNIILTKFMKQTVNGSDYWIPLYQ